MKREFLKELGIADELIDKIMAAHGTGVEAHKRKAEEAEGKLATANNTIADLQKAAKAFEGVDVKGLQEKIDTLTTKYDTDTATLKRDYALDMALVSAKVKNPKVVKGALKLEEIKLDGDKLLGLDTQLKALETSDPYLFATEEAKPGTPLKIDSAGTHSTTPPAGEQFNPFAFTPVTPFPTDKK